MFLCDFRFQLKSWRSLRRSTKPSERASCNKRTPSTDTRYGAKRCVGIWVKAQKPGRKMFDSFWRCCYKKTRLCGLLSWESKIRLSAARLPPPGPWTHPFVASSVTLISPHVSLLCQVFVSKGKNSSRPAAKMFFIILPEDCVCRWIYWNCINESLSAATHPDGNWEGKKTKTKRDLSAGENFPVHLLVLSSAASKFAAFGSFSLDELI